MTKKKDTERIVCVVALKSFDLWREGTVYRVVLNETVAHLLAVDYLQEVACADET